MGTEAAGFDNLHQRVELVDNYEECSDKEKDRMVGKTGRVVVRMFVEWA